MKDNQLLYDYSFELYQNAELLKANFMTVQGNTIQFLVYYYNDELILAIFFNYMPIKIINLVNEL